MLRTAFLKFIHMHHNSLSKEVSKIQSKIIFVLMQKELYLWWRLYVKKPMWKICSMRQMRSRGPITFKILRINYISPVYSPYTSWFHHSVPGIRTRVPQSWIGSDFIYIRIWSDIRILDPDPDLLYTDPTFKIRIQFFCIRIHK